MAHLRLLAARLFNTPLLVEPHYAETVVTVLADRLNVEPMLRQGDMQVDRRPARSPVLMQGGLMVIPVIGGLYHRGDSLDAWSGAQSYTNLQNMLVEAADSPDVKGILLDIDSPGGEATGCFEFADAIAEVAKFKPVRAIANGRAASAAYAIGCAVDRFYMTPSGEVGSIGVAWMHTDMSDAIERRGVVITHLYAGKHKIDGASSMPLSDQAREEFQSKIDTAYQMFVDHVAQYRDMDAGEVRKTQARTFMSEGALDLGLVDEIASFDDVRRAFADDLNPKFRVSPNGAVSRMSKTTAAPVAQQGATIEGLDEALAAARNEGRTAAVAENEKAVTEAYAKGRADAGAILKHANASGRMASAATFAANAKFTVDEAAEMLATLPADADTSASDYRAKLKAADPKITADTPEDQRPANSYGANVLRHMATIKGVNR